MSCDFLPTESEGPHYWGDVLDLLNLPWDLMIAHPPCTYLTCSAEWAYKDVQTKNIKPGTLIGKERRVARQQALEFVTELWNAPIPKIAIENPVGVINTRLPFMPKPQWVQQHQFGEDASKKTGLWLKGLPPLSPTQLVEPRLVEYPPGSGKQVKRWANQTDSGQNREPPAEDRWKTRSYTPKGLALAMADQWGKL